MGLAYRLRQHAKRPLRRHAPGLYARALALWSGLHPDAGAASGEAGPPAALSARAGEQVAHGPFAGLRYRGASVGSVSAAKLVGSYEAELHPLFREIAGQGFERIVDVGCAEGFYAVGLARLLPQARVIAVDPLAAARAACRRLAEDNGVADRLELHGAADAGALRRWCRGRCLLLLDCEGAEEGLLRPKRVPGLAGCHILVELHDFVDPGLSDRVLPRFRDTHRCTLVAQQPREAADWPVLEGLEPALAARLLDERRPRDLQWAWLTPRAA